MTNHVAQNFFRSEHFWPLPAPWSKSDVWGLFWIHTSTGTISCSTDCRRCHFGRKKFFQDFCQKKFCSSFFTRLFSQWWITTLPNTPLPIQYTIYYTKQFFKLRIYNHVTYSQSEWYSPLRCPALMGQSRWSFDLKWTVPWDESKCRSGRSKRVKLDGPKVSNWTVRNCQSGRSKSVKANDPKVPNRLD